MLISSSTDNPNAVPANTIASNASCGKANAVNEIHAWTVHVARFAVVCLPLPGTCTRGTSFVLMSLYVSEYAAIQFHVI